MGQIRSLAVIHVRNILIVYNVPPDLDQSASDVVKKILVKSTDQSLSHRKLESMVCCWRPSVHHRGFRHGGGHDTGTGLPLLWSRTKKVSS